MTALSQYFDIKIAKLKTNCKANIQIEKVFQIYLLHIREYLAGIRCY